MAKILVVDDEANIRTLIKKYAQYEGYGIVEAVNGIDAIAKCRAEDFDLIVMDVMMPELDGFSAVREIRKNTNKTQNRYQFRSDARLRDSEIMVI